VLSFLVAFALLFVTFFGFNEDSGFAFFDLGAGVVAGDDVDASLLRFLPAEDVVAIAAEVFLLVLTRAPSFLSTPSGRNVLLLISWDS